MFSQIKEKAFCCRFGDTGIGSDLKVELRQCLLLILSCEFLRIFLNSMKIRCSEHNVPNGILRRAIKDSHQSGHEGHFATVEKRFHSQIPWHLVDKGQR